MNKPSKFVVSILILIVTLPLSGCLVDEDDPLRTIKLGTDLRFRILTGGEFYNYIVDAQMTTAGNTTFLEGSLTVQYTLTTLPEPFNTSGLISPVLREDSVLTLGLFSYNLRRYLQQNSSTGAISVLAVESGSTLYRAGNSITNPQAIEIIESPLTTTIATGPSLSFDYMQGCETVTPSCSSVIAQSINKTLDYQGVVNAGTLEGIFEAVRIDFSGSFTGGSAPTLFDMVGACDQNNATFFGAEYIYPQVGIIRIENACISAGGGSGHSYTARLSNTNVPLP